MLLQFGDGADAQLTLPYKTLLLDDRYIASPALLQELYSYPNLSGPFTPVPLAFNAMSPRQSQFRRGSLAGGPFREIVPNSLGKRTKDENLK